MRRVYHTESSRLGLATSVIMGVGLAGILFGVLPFAHQIAKPERVLELRKTAALDLPPPAEEESAPPPLESEAPPETLAEPELTEVPQQVPLSADLEVAVGAGGALAGFGETQRLATEEAIQNEAVVDVADLEKRPEPVSQVPPVYPAELRRAKIEGTVTLVFVLNDQGRVEDPRVENSSRPEFEKPAVDALRRWRFRPGMKEGQAVSTYMRLPMRFRVTP